VHVEWRPEQGLQHTMTYADRVRGRSDEEVACCFVSDARGSEPTDAEKALLREAFSSVAREQEQ
jgi:exonuclease SbcD